MINVMNDDINFRLIKNLNLTLVEFPFHLYSLNSIYPFHFDHIILLLYLELTYFCY